MYLFPNTGHIMHTARWAKIIRKENKKMICKCYTTHGCTCSHMQNTTVQNPNIHVIMCRAIHQIAKCNT